ncbi:MAG: thioredoxin domain-containing protein [Synechococcales bacterium]|nr:thioredoxin domain-containing protein [Synechococcales bacterium]
MGIPIPGKPVGYRRGRCEAPVQVTAFVDIECPFSKKAWSTLLALSDHYGAEKVGITVCPTVLCDHRQSWDLLRAAVWLAHGDATTFWNFLTFLYERQEKFANEAFDDQTRQDLYQMIEGFIAEFTGKPVDPNLGDRLTQEALITAAKEPVRFAISQGVWSTPTFFINGGEADQLSSSSHLKDWQEVLDALLDR